MSETLTVKKGDLKGYVRVINDPAWDLVVNCPRFKREGSEN